MSSLDKMGHRVRRRTRTDGVVVEERGPAADAPTELDSGRVETLSPPRVRLRSGDLVAVDGYVQTGVQPAVGDRVVVLRKGGFVLMIGKVVLV